MSFHLIEGTPIASQSPLIKARDVPAFTAAAALLREARRIAADAEAADAEARRAGYGAGLAEGLAEAERLIAAEAGKFAEAIEAIRKDYTAHIAEAAYAATVAIIGELDDVETVSRIVALQLARQDDSANLQLILSPSVHTELTAKLGENSAVTILADPALAPTDCHVISGQGRIIASLSLQLQMLRERWGLDQDSTEMETAE
jgi:flagellar biosynthesis/type III secretory pathway protein FliH